MKFKEIEIATGASWFGSYNVIASYHDYYDEHRDMIEKISSFPPHKGDVIHVIDKNTHQRRILAVAYCSIDYIENSLTIWCK